MREESPPPSPTGVRVSDHDAASATVEWDIPNTDQDDDENKIVAFLVEYKGGEDSADEWTEWPERFRPKGSKRGRGTVQGLDKGATYQFRVRLFSTLPRRVIFNFLILLPT